MKCLPLDAKLLTLKNNQGIWMRTDRSHGIKEKEFITEKGI
jgi:hypothetical protein